MVRNILLFLGIFIFSVSCVNRSGKVISGNEVEDTAASSTIVNIIDTTKIEIAMDDLKLTKNPERFDEERYERLKKNEDSGVEILRDGTVIEMGDALACKSLAATPLNSYFRLVKIYNPQTNIIQSKGWSYAYNVHFAIGIWYEFNEYGELESEEDYDAPFKFSFDDILKFCQKNGIKVSRGYIPQSTGFHTTIDRDITEGKSWWQIEHLIVRGKLFFIETIKLDGTTGKVISRTEDEYINN